MLKKRKKKALKMKNEKKSSENDQLIGHFQSFFLSPDLKSEKKTRKSTNKKNCGLNSYPLFNSLPASSILWHLLIMVANNLDPAYRSDLTKRLA